MSETPCGTAAPSWATLLSRDSGEVVFAEPWQAQAFAITVGLSERGAFTWAEWTRVFGAELSRARAAGTEETGPVYFDLWLNALERLSVEKALATPEQLLQLKAAWAAAYADTPHGRPVALPRKERSA